MRRYILVTFMILAVAAFCVAQKGAPTTDVLGAHLNYGRGCAACHAPHSGAYGNGAAKTADPNAGSNILWGQDVGSLYGKTINFGQTLGRSGSLSSYTEVLPSSLTATTPDVTGLLACLSCHDGNWAQGAMMKNAVYESLPSTYGGWNTIPTLLGNDRAGVGVTDYLADHPVGLNAIISCGGAYNWDCTITNGVISMTGTNSSAFVTNYGFFVSPSAYNGNPVVVCTTCHDQHFMNVVNVTSSHSGLPAGYYETMFFLVGPYNPNTTTSGSNQTAQFCRQCHGYNANEMNGALNIPTTF